MATILEGAQDHPHEYDHNEVIELGTDLLRD